MNITKRIMSIILTLALAFTLIPTMPITTNAAAATAMETGAGSITVGDIVYYGTYPQSSYTPLQTPGSPVDGETYTDADDTEFMYKDNYYYKIEPIAWRVLKNEDGKLFVISEKILEYHIFNSYVPSTTWETSSIRAWLNGYSENNPNYGDNFNTKAFNAGEQAAIANTHVTNNVSNSFGVNGGNDTNDKIFLLSLDEVQDDSLGFTDDNSRQAYTTAYARNTGSGYNENRAAWWLRSLGNFDAYNYFAAHVFWDGEVSFIGYSVDFESYAAPRSAFNLDLSSVLFTSDAAGGKSTVVGGNLSVVTPPNGAVKFTVLDSSLELTSVMRTGITGRRIDFAYTGAMAGKTLSAVVLDNNGAVKYYGKLADNIAANGDASVTLPEGFTDTDTMQIFVEELGSDYYTDFASGYKQLDIPGNLEGAVTITGMTAYGETLTADISLTSSDPGKLSYQWKRGTTDIGTNSTYILSAADIGQTITVTVTAANYFGSLTSPGVTAGKASQATLTVVGGNVTKTYGDAVFTLTTSGGSSTGAVAWQSSHPSLVSVNSTSGLVTIHGATNATAVEITATKSGGTNYNDTSATVTVTVNKATLTVTADSKSRAYGAANPTFTVSYDGFVNGEDEDSLTTKPTAACAANATTPAGTVSITVSGGESDNYSFSYQSGTLTITQAGQPFGTGDNSNMMLWLLLGGASLTILGGIAVAKRKKKRFYVKTK